jgi:RHS repeat-associated protein
VKWSFNWQTYVTDDPTLPGSNVSRYLPAGGAYYYSGYNAGTGRFTAQTDDGSVLALSSQSPVSYKRQLADGSTEIYSQSDGSTSYPRNIYLSDVVDAQGNDMHFNYDGQHRLTSLTDAAGRQTTFSYGLSSFPTRVTAITDPFGRSATLAYDSSGRLTGITDVIGITSNFHYDANSLVDSMTTPYGTTTFAYTAPGASGPPRFLDVTDPLGNHEREEWLEPAPIAASDPANTVPTGMPLAPENNYLQYRDSFHWDKDQYVAAGCAVSGGCDYTKARDTHFAHYGSLKSSTVESIKQPLENRVWYQYPGQTDSFHSGSFNQPIAIARVLDDGTTQLTSIAYDASNYFLTTQAVDPIGRTTNFAYANGVDLQAVGQKAANGSAVTLTQFIYDYRHRPIYRFDASGQVTTYGYNAAGQLVSSTDPLGHTTQFQYNTTGDLTHIVDANGITVESRSYDAFDRIASVTDSQGWSVSYVYDNADRLTAATYPDGTADKFNYDKLDLASYTDRLGREWSYSHDANRNLTAITDPTKHQALLGYTNEGHLKSLSDGNTNVTSWAYDIEGRPTSKSYADNSLVTYTYETTTSRLKSQTDALNQTKQYAYAADNRLLGISYLNAVNPTAGVTFTYDPWFPRITTMTDGTGTTQYSYIPVGSAGALRVLQETGPPTGRSINYTYDALGRLASRTVSGAGAESFQYDNLGRVASHTSDLGTFTFTYLGETPQTTQRSLSGSILSTQWSYLPNSGDRRLKEIDNFGLSAGQYSNFQITSDSAGNSKGVTVASDATTGYPVVSSQAATYNNLNQLTNLSGQPLTYDADGNLLSDGTRNYSWDAENRLIAISYPGQTGKQTAFSYDGLGRRFSLASTPVGGGSVVTTNYVWCGLSPCQARDQSGTPIREYLAEGEYMPATSQPLYYGIDQIGSVRRVFVSSSSAPAYDYDEYGVPLQATAPLTDAGYAGMVLNQDSGLNLTLHRAYDPVGAHWLSRDPLGEISSGGANLYAYVEGNPATLTDPYGLCWNWPNLPPWVKNHPYLTGGAVIAIGTVTVTTICVFGGCEVAAVAGAAEGADALIGGAQSALARTLLSDQLAAESAASPFTETGELTDEAIAQSKEIMTPEELNNPDIPSGYSKYSTQTYQSPSGDFQTHYYMNSNTGDVYYGSDYKAVFNRP